MDKSERISMATLSFKSRLERFLFVIYVRLWVLMTIKLPDEFNKVIKGLNPLRDYTIDDAYFDEDEWTIDNGLKKLRKHLEITRNNMVCDGYCNINYNGLGTRHILLEGKDTSGEPQLQHTYDQLQDTATRLWNKYKIKPDYAIITDLRLPRTFEALKYMDTHLKYLRSKTSIRPKPYNLRFSSFDCPILIGRH